MTVSKILRHLLSLNLMNYHLSFVESSPVSKGQRCGDEGELRLLVNLLRQRSISAGRTGSVAEDQIVRSADDKALLKGRLVEWLVHAKRVVAEQSSVHHQLDQSANQTRPSLGAVDQDGGLLLPHWVSNEKVRIDGVVIARDGLGWRIGVRLSSVQFASQCLATYSARVAVGENLNFFKWKFKLFFETKFRKW